MLSFRCLVKSIRSSSPNGVLEVSGIPKPPPSRNQQTPLNELKVGEKGTVVGVRESSTPFLRYLDQLGLGLGAKIEILEKYEYDNSAKILLNKSKEIVITGKVCLNLFLQK